MTEAIKEETIKQEISDGVAPFHQGPQLPPIALCNIGCECMLLIDILEIHLEVLNVRAPKEVARQRLCCFLTAVFSEGAWDTSQPPFEPSAGPVPPPPSYRCQVGVLRFTLRSDGDERRYLLRITCEEQPNRLATRIPARQAGQPVFLRPLVENVGPITWLYTDSEGSSVPYDAIIFAEECQDLSAQRKMAADHFDRAERQRVAYINSLLAMEMAHRRLARWAKIPNRADWRVEEDDKRYYFVRPLSAWDAMQRDHEADARALASRSAHLYD